MSSRGRGRGGRAMEGTMLSNSAELAELVAGIQGTPSKLYPDFAIPEARPPTADEKMQVKFLKEVQASIMHETPFYIQVREKVTGTLPDGIERYSDRWQAKQRTAQSLVDLRTDERFFPEELLPVLRGDNAARKKRKQQKFDLTKFLDMNGETDPDMLETASNAGDATGVPGEKDSDESGVDEENDAFSEEDDNDYEQNYFSDGANDFEDVGDNEETY